MNHLWFYTSSNTFEIYSNFLPIFPHWMNDRNFGKLTVEYQVNWFFWWRNQFFKINMRSIATFSFERLIVIHSCVRSHLRTISLFQILFGHDKTIKTMFVCLCAFFELSSMVMWLIYFIVSCKTAQHSTIAIPSALPTILFSHFSFVDSRFNCEREREEREFIVFNCVLILLIDFFFKIYPSI